MAELTLSLDSESLSLLLNNNNNNNNNHQLDSLDELIDIDDYIGIDNDDNKDNYNNKSCLNQLDCNNNDCNKQFMLHSSIWTQDQDTLSPEFYQQTYNNFYDYIEQDTDKDFGRCVPDYFDQNEIIADRVNQSKLQPDQDKQLSDSQFDIIQQSKQKQQQQQNQQKQNQFTNNGDATRLIQSIENIKMLWDTPKVLFNRTLNVMQLDENIDDDSESPYFTEAESELIENFLIEMSHRNN